MTGSSMLRSLFRPGVISRRPWLSRALSVFFALLIATYALGVASRFDPDLQGKDVPAVGLVALMLGYLYTKRAVWGFIAIEVLWIISIAVYNDQIIRVLAMGPCVPVYTLIGWIGDFDEFAKEGFVCPTSISAALWVTALLFFVELRGFLKRSRLQVCERCGYDVRANPRGACSECGWQPRAP